MSISHVLSADDRFSATQATHSGRGWTTTPLSQDRRHQDGFGQSEPTVRFAANNEIYGEGDETQSFYKILSGVVRVCKFLSDGRRQIDAFHMTGDVFGFESGVKHRLSAEAVSDCAVICYRWKGVAALVAEDDRLTRHLFSHAMYCLERAQEHSLLLGCGNATQRLAAFLLEMADRNPRDDIINLTMTRQDIADYLGLTVETVSRTLSQFERDAVIRLRTARCIRLKNRAALRRLIS